MWIRRISISSFGLVKDFCEELKDNMTVVYGLNEAGKSTIAEFIRTTLFPNRSKSTRYPIDDKSDCGYIEIQMDNKDTRTLKRKNKKVREKDGKKTFYEEMKGFDLQTYGSIYGLNLKELSNNESTSAKKLKDRILETMGGENVPGIRKHIEYKLDSLMNKERRGNKPIDLFLQRREEISWAREKIKSELSRYDEKIEEKKRLEDRIKKGKAKRREKEALRIVESNRENVERYKRLMEEYERDVEFSKDLLPRDLETYDRLNWEVDNISKKVNSSDNVSVIKEAEKIDEVWKNRDCYFRHLEDIEKIESDMDLDKKEIKEIEEITGWKVVDVLSVDDVDKIDKETKREIDRRNKQVYRFLPYFGNGIMVSVAILMGILLVLQVNKAIEIPALLFGGVYLLFGSLLRFRNEFLNKKWLDYIKFKGFYENTTPELASKLLEKLRDLARVANRFDSRKESLSQHKGYVSEYENSVVSLLSRLEMSDKRIPGRIGEVVEEVHNILTNARGLITDLNLAHSGMDDIFKKYGGKDRFTKKYDVKKDLKERHGKIEDIKRAVELATKVSIEEVMSLIDSRKKEEMGLSDEIENCSKRIGELENEICYIEKKSSEIGDLDVEYNSVEAELRNSLYEWAVNSLAESMVHDATCRFYDRVKQIIHDDACHYLSLMTESRYELISDPAGDKLVVRDNFGDKDVSKWSSGLSDQIYLSIKMAIAQRISSEKIPMIMDDVLVRFDSYRKKAACDAIYEFSRKNQVILFTCDCFVRDYFKNGKGHVIELSA